MNHYLNQLRPLREDAQMFLAFQQNEDRTYQQRYPNQVSLFMMQPQGEPIYNIPTNQILAKEQSPFQIKDEHSESNMIDCEKFVKNIMDLYFGGSFHKMETNTHHLLTHGQCEQPQGHYIIHKYPVYKQLNEMLTENRPFTVKYSMWEKYIPETQNLLIQCFEMSSLYCVYEASISLEMLKEDDSHYDRLTREVIERMLNDNQNAEIYFLEYGRVLRSYCLVDIAQIQVLKKAILLLQSMQSLTPLCLIMGSFDNQDQQLNKQAQEILIRHEEIKSCHQNLGENMKLILSLENQSKLEECDTPSQLTPFNQSLDDAYFTFKTQQSFSVAVQQMIKDQFQSAELKKILKLKSQNFCQYIGIDAVNMIILNVIFGYFKLNSLSIQSPKKQTQPIIENLLRLIRQYFFKFNETRKKKFQINPKLSIVDAKKLVSQDYGQFKDPENQHFPEKQQNCIKCKVCRKKAGDPLLQQQGHQSIHKTKYRCKGCFIKLQRNISLCITPCFEEFHLDPEYFLSRNKKVATGIVVQQPLQVQDQKSSFI